VIANFIYQEIIPRTLVVTTQDTIHHDTVWYQNPDKSLNIAKLLAGFQQFYREHSQMWIEKFIYKESAPHLLMMAFLQRIINGGGTIHREYALGRRRVDLYITWPHGDQRVVIELKVHRDKSTLSQGLIQTADYVDTCGAAQGHLIIFDKTVNKSCDEKIYQKEETVKGKTITVWGV